MRLLNVETLKLQTFNDKQIPDYAILSHTWGADEDEVSFSDIVNGASRSDTNFAKLKGACRQAQSDGWQYIWIDTCCIDKTSSAELSEAINSMYRWYAEAQVCYAYLSDVVYEDCHSHNSLMRSFREAKWWSRGWTLQELLAPRNVIFLSSTWSEIGTCASLRHEISDTSGINTEHLKDPRRASVAAKMSWASGRYTTRTEDIAYCLLGLFDINFPLLYGEGEKAFLRLQREIMGSVTDDTIFAWKHPSDDYPRSYAGIFATHPRYFADSGDFKSAREVSNVWAFRPGTLQTTATIGTFTEPDTRVQRLLAQTVRFATRGYQSEHAKFIASQTQHFKQLVLGYSTTAEEGEHVYIYLLEVSPQHFVRALPGELLPASSGQVLEYLQKEPKQPLHIHIKAPPIQKTIQPKDSQTLHISRASYSQSITLIPRLIPSKISQPLTNDLGTLELQEGGGGATLFFETRKNNHFLLILGIEHNEPRMQVLLPSDDEPWSQMQRGFGKRPLRLQNGWGESDRFTGELLNGGVHVSVSMKRSRQNNQSMMFVTIAVGTRLSPSNMVIG